MARRLRACTCERLEGEIIPIQKVIAHAPVCKRCSDIVVQFLNTSSDEPFPLRYSYFTKEHGLMPGETNPKPPPALQDLDPETRKHIDDAAYKRRIEDLVRQAEQAREKQLLPIRYQHAYHRLQRDLLRLIQAHSSVPKEDIIDALTDASAELT